jgi:hypothetical protein
MDLEENSHAITEVLSQHLPGGSEKNHKKINQNSPCPGPNLS